MLQRNNKEKYTPVELCSRFSTKVFPLAESAKLNDGAGGATCRSISSIGCGVHGCWRRQAKLVAASVVTLTVHFSWSPSGPRAKRSLGARRQHSEPPHSGTRQSPRVQNPGHRPLNRRALRTLRVVAMDSGLTPMALLIFARLASAGSNEIAISFGSRTSNATRVVLSFRRDFNSARQPAPWHGFRSCCADIRRHQSGQWYPRHRHNKGNLHAVLDP